MLDRKNRFQFQWAMILALVFYADLGFCKQSALEEGPSAHPSQRSRISTGSEGSMAGPLAGRQGGPRGGSVDLRLGRSCSSDGPEALLQPMNFDPLAQWVSSEPQFEIPWAYRSRSADGKEVLILSGVEEDEEEGQPEGKPETQPKTKKDQLIVGSWLSNGSVKTCFKTNDPKRVILKPLLQDVPKGASPHVEAKLARENTSRVNGLTEEALTAIEMVHILDLDRHPVPQLEIPRPYRVGADLIFVSSAFSGDLHAQIPKLSPQQKIHALREVAHALIPLHEKGWVHGDIKGANILMEGERVALTDVGSARTFVEYLKSYPRGRVGGTQGYTDENYQNPIELNDVDRMDIFQLGVVMFKLNQELFRTHKIDVQDHSHCQPTPSCNVVGAKKDYDEATKFLHEKCGATGGLGRDSYECKYIHLYQRSISPTRSGRPTAAEFIRELDSLPLH